MAIPPFTANLGSHNWTTPHFDDEIIESIFIQDPWCKMPGDEDIKSFLKSHHQALTAEDISRITEKLKFKLSARLAKEMGNFAL